MQHRVTDLRPIAELEDAVRVDQVYAVLEPEPHEFDLGEDREHVSGVGMATRSRANLGRPSR